MVVRWEVADLSRRVRPGRDIYARGASGDSVQRQAVNVHAEECSPSLSPDGRWLAYGSDESGRFEIYVRRFPNTGAARWQVSREGRDRAVVVGDGAGTLL